MLKVLISSIYQQVIIGYSTNKKINTRSLHSMFPADIVITSGSFIIMGRNWRVIKLSQLGFQIRKHCFIRHTG